MISYDEIKEMSKNVVFELNNSSKHVAILMDGKVVECVFANRYAFHAEELAVSHYRRNSGRIKRPRVYVTRLSDVHRLSRPCHHCCQLLKRYPQIRVFFTTSDGSWIEEKTFDTTHVSYRRQELGHSRQK